MSESEAVVQTARANEALDKLEQSQARLRELTAKLTQIAAYIKPILAASECYLSGEEVAEGIDRILTKGTSA